MRKICYLALAMLLTSCFGNQEDEDFTPYPGGRLAIQSSQIKKN
jgi:hypothetical protein